MNLVNFEHTFAPAIANDVTAWHVSHGWIWNVIEVRTHRPIGVFYCTFLCGDGCVCHFDTFGTLSPAVILASFKKGVRMIKEHCPVIYATIPAEKSKLIRCACRLGFKVIPDAGFERDGVEMTFLKYFGAQKSILYQPNQRKE